MKFLFFLFAVGTCQVTWKGKSGKWLVILDEYCQLDTIGQFSPSYDLEISDGESRRSLVGPPSSNDNPLFEPSTLILTPILGKFKSNIKP